MKSPMRYAIRVLQGLLPTLSTAAIYVVRHRSYGRWRTRPMRSRTQPAEIWQMISDALPARFNRITPSLHSSYVIAHVQLSAAAIKLHAGLINWRSRSSRWLVGNQARASKGKARGPAKAKGSNHSMASSQARANKPLGMVAKVRAIRQEVVVGLATWALASSAKLPAYRESVLMGNHCQSRCKGLDRPAAHHQIRQQLEAL